jgi:NCAIR mutase (PurE)-related protein
MAQGIGDEPPFGEQARPDLARESRRGIPEVILAEAKTAEQVIAIARQFLDGVGRALISRISPETAAAVIAALPDATARLDEIARTLCLTLPHFTPVATGGHVGILTAGIADLPVAAEARFMAEAMGCRVTMVCDVGVAGVHRLFRPLDELLAAGVDCIVVAAGMDGALPSLVSGLVPCPVVGLPTPVGYGMGGQGHGALLAMLQSCSPGLAVVNIGNGIGAGSFAGLIANRMADARRDRARSAAPAGHV